MLEYKSSHGGAALFAVRNKPKKPKNQLKASNFINYSNYCFLTAASCPQHSHYEVCADTCGMTCASLISPVSCYDACFEGCQCDDGYVFDGVQCVSMDKCGCEHNGRYLTVTFKLMHKDYFFSTDETQLFTERKIITFTYTHVFQGWSNSCGPTLYIKMRVPGLWGSEM